jgi:hypothetical protein
MAAEIGNYVENEVMNDNQTGWPSAAVAIAILALIGAVTVAAIFRYQTLAEALQIWQAMAALIGIVTGAFVTYFFTRGTVETAQGQARIALQQAAQEARRADASQQALTKAAGLLPPQQFEGLLADPGFRVAMSLADDANGRDSTTTPSGGIVRGG